MACLEHLCTNPKCDWSTMSNSRWQGSCPKCGERVTSVFDEDVDRDEDSGYGPGLDYDDEEPDEEPEDAEAEEVDDFNDDDE